VFPQSQGCEFLRFRALPTTGRISPFHPNVLKGKYNMFDADITMMWQRQHQQILFISDDLPFQIPEPVCHGNSTPIGYASAC
jgi:hypothetical protein